MNRAVEWLKTWRLLSWRSTVVVAVALYAVTGFFIVPWVVEGQIETRSLEILGRQATVEKVRCNPFTLSLTIEGFSLPDRPGSVLLSFDRLYANAQLSSVFRWAATLKELRIDNPYVALRRFEDGEVNVLEVLADLPEQEPDADDDGLPRALLQLIQIVDGRIDIEDRYRPQPLLWEMGPSEIELRDISTISEHEGSNDLVIGIIGGGEIRANGRVVVEPLGFDGRLVVENLVLPNTWEAVDYMFDFDPTGGVLEIDLSYRIALEDDGLHLTVDDADLQIDDFGFRSEEHDADLLRVDGISVSGGHLEWPEQNVTADAVVIEGARAFGWVEPDGTPNWDVLVPEATRERIVETYKTLEERIHATAALGRFELRDAGADFEDETMSPPVRFRIHDVDLVVTDITTEEGSTWPVEASVMFQEDAVGRARGRVGVAPLDVELEVGLEGLDLAKYRDYVARFAPLDLRAGTLEASGTAKASREKGAGVLTASYEGGFEVKALNLNETVTNGKLLGWGDLKVAGLTARFEPLGAEVTDVDITTAGLEITVAEDGTINLLEFFKAVSEGDGRGAVGGDEGGGLPSVQIARVRLRDCYGLYTDRTVTGAPFELGIRPVNGTLSAISTTGAHPATLDIEAGVSSGGFVRVGGELDIFDYTRFADLSVDVRDVGLPAFSPMTVKFTGHPITGGDVSLDLDYDIADRFLRASNRIEADDLVLGDKVEGEGLVSLPFKLGVSLLKDKEGRITLDIPFEGSFDTPGFGIGTAAAAASKEIFSELVKSPFKLLGKLGGGGDEDLEYVEFAAGSAVLDERAAAKLDTLSRGLGERPALALTIVGAWEPESDAAALRLQELNAVLTARGVTREQLDTVVPITILEDLYRSTFPEPTVETVRSQYTSIDPEVPEGPGGLDEVGYGRALREALVNAQPVDPAAIEALASARAEAIRDALVHDLGVDTSRVGIEEPAAAGESGGGWVRCRLELGAGG